MAAVLLFWNTNMAAVTSCEKSGNKDLRSHLGIRTRNLPSWRPHTLTDCFNPCLKCIEIIDCCHKHSMMQFHGFFMHRHFFSHNCTGHPTETGTSNCLRLHNDTFPGMADYVKIWQNMFLFARKIGKADPYYHMIYNEVLSIRNDFLYPSNCEIYEKEPQYNETSSI